MQIQRQHIQVQYMRFQIAIAVRDTIGVGNTWEKFVIDIFYPDETTNVLTWWCLDNLWFLNILF